MTRDEKIKMLREYCDKTADFCPNCDLSQKGLCDEETNFSKLVDTDLNELLEAAGLVTPISESAGKQAEEQIVEHDAVNHPDHYTNGGMECIDEMILLFGKEAVKNFCQCNAWKYRRRALYKNGEEDMQKSHWYIAKYKELEEGIRNELIDKLISQPIQPV